MSLRTLSIAHLDSLSAHLLRHCSVPPECRVKCILQSYEASHDGNVKINNIVDDVITRLLHHSFLYPYFFFLIEPNNKSIWIQQSPAYESSSQAESPIRLQCLKSPHSPLSIPRTLEALAGFSSITFVLRPTSLESLQETLTLVDEAKTGSRLGISRLIWTQRPKDQLKAVLEFLHDTQPDVPLHLELTRKCCEHRSLRYLLKKTARLTVNGCIIDEGILRDGEWRSDHHNNSCGDMSWGNMCKAKFKSKGKARRRRNEPGDGWGQKTRGTSWLKKKRNSDWTDSDDDRSSGNRDTSGWNDPPNSSWGNPPNSSLGNNANEEPWSYDDNNTFIGTWYNSINGERGNKSECEGQRFSHIVDLSQTFLADPPSLLSNSMSGASSG